ncbi:hypothetical protein [Pseudoalteromonas sp. CH_XMU1449-3]|uniref:hypothetical protein n=1 Tax=Pseudoalteromonas sp. CH_XMU1449-3 TaxID=3107774 RepID=UPI00300BDA8E
MANKTTIKKLLGLLNNNLTEIVENTQSDDAKWEFLYTYSRQSLDEEIARYQILDAKATKLLSTSSLILTTYLFFFKWVVIDSPTQFSLCVYTTAAFTFAALFTSLFFYFRSMKLMKSKRMPIDPNILETFKNNDLPTIYVSLYKACSECEVENIKLNEKKAKAIKNGYTFTAITGLLLLILILSIFFERNNYATEKTTTHEAVTMTKKENESKKKTKSPNFDVPPPPVKLVTNNNDKVNNTEKKGS